jgi:4-amino-4-deoxy-L-arabinose transferase-like glycosyltransferase
MFSRLRPAASFVGLLFGLTAFHYPLLHLPYFWDEAGYYVPAAWDVYRNWDLVPTSTLPTGHTPLAMIYLALVWHIFEFSPFVTRAAMVLIAAGTVTVTYTLARRVADREPAVWAALLLAISPMFFAQSTVVYLDLPAALFTTLAVIALLDERLWWFALMASLAVMTKETAVVLLPVAWAYCWWRARNGRCATSSDWMATLLPLLPLAIWTLYYHHKTGFWTGNVEYLQYNLYSTLSPARILWSLLRRMYEVFVGGFNWVLVVGAVAGIWRGKKDSHRDTEAQRRILLLAAGLIAAYLLMLSVVGGAVLPRYLLPIFPVFFVASVELTWRLRRAVRRGVCAAAAAGFIAAWFINPAYPFAYENNLAYADFIRLHQEAAKFLASRPAGERILTAWPATDELSRPMLGYVARPLNTVPLEGFTEKDFEAIAARSFDILYLYSRKWEPDNNWLSRVPVFGRAQERHFGYASQIRDEALVARYHLKLLRQFEQRGQWVRIYEKQAPEVGSQQSE